MVFPLYCLLAIFFTYPLIFYLSTHMQGAGDGVYFLWELWWFSHSLLRGQNPIHNNTIFYPAQDVRMVWVTASNELPAVLLEPLVGPVATYNILVLFNIALSGYTAYLLVKYLTKNPLAAFVSGFIYAYSPFHFINAFKGLLNITTWQWIPLCALAWFQLLEKPCLRKSLLFGIALSLVALSDVYIFAYSFVLLLPALFLYGIKKRGLRSLAPWTGISLVTFSLLSAPFLQSFVVMARISTHAQVAGYDVGMFSQHFLRFVIPYKFHPIWGQYFTWFYPDPYFEASCFIGYIPLALGILALYKAKERDVRIFWGVLGGIALIFSLGPYLHVWDIVTIGSRPVPMPYIILSYLPFFSFLRLPVRFCIIVMLSLAVLSGLALTRLKNILAYAALIMGISLEYVLLFPYPLTDAAIPAFYSRIKNDPSIKAILELPSGQYGPDDIWNTYKYMYYQTFHHKPMVSGHTPRVPDGLVEFTHETPLLRELTHPQILLKGDIVPLDMEIVAREGLEILKKYTIDPIILHKDKDARDALSLPELMAIKRLLRRSLGPPDYEDENVASFRVKSHKPLESRQLLPSIPCLLYTSDAADE